VLAAAVVSAAAAAVEVTVDNGASDATVTAAPIPFNTSRRGRLSSGVADACDSFDSFSDMRMTLA
jgi:hypothetical protein